MKQIIVAFVLLNFVIGAWLYVGVVMVGHQPLADWIAYELAQALGVMQAILFYTMRSNK